MSWAERAYNYKTNGKGLKEDEEDVANRLIQRRNRLFVQIGKISNHKELMEVNNELKAIEEAGYTDRNDLVILRKHLQENVQELKQSLKTKHEEVVKKQDLIKQERFAESTDTLMRLDAEANNILLQLLMQLSADRVKNKVIVSNVMQTKDRASAITLIKLSQMSAYESLITPSMKETLLILSKSDKEIKWQEEQKYRVSEVGKELADVTMKRFMLNKAEAVIFPKQNIVFS